MVIWHRFWHTVRICNSTHLMVLLLALGAATTGTILQCRAEAVQLALNRGLILAEVVLPLTAMVALGHVFVTDHDARFTEVLRTYPTRRTMLVLERLAVGAFFVAVGIVPVLTSLDYWTPASIELTWPNFLPTALYLAGIGLLTATLTRNWVAGLAFGTFYWIMDMATRGKLTQVLFLFPQTMGGRRGTSLYTSRMWLVICGLTLLTAAAWFYRKQLKAE